MSSDHEYPDSQTIERDAHSYFVPMVDMLAGVVFILVIMLAATALLSRQDFSQIEPMQQEIIKIKNDLAEARTLERSLLTPRLEARQKLSDLLERIKAKVVAEGVDAIVLPSEGRLELTEPDLFSDGVSEFSEKGRRVALAIAESIVEESACTAGSQGKQVTCSLGGLQLASVRVVAGAANMPEHLQAFRSLSYLNLIVGARPELMGLQGAGGYRLMEYDKPDVTDSSTITLKFDLAPIPGL